MGISPEKSTSNTASAAHGASGQPATILHRRILYRGPLLVALLACVVSWTGITAAQEERPQITPGERKVPRKKEAGPRALGILQMSANGKTSLIPVAILVNGKFWDASAYKADPIPMALETDTVYEAQRAGSSLGLFTVSSALHSNAVNVPSPWIGTGKWVPNGSDTANKAQKAESVPAGIDHGEGPPRLTRDPTKVSQPARPPASPTPQSQTTKPSDSGDEPPRLSPGTPPPPAPPAGSSPAGQSQPGSTAPNAPDAAKPSDSKPNDAKADDRASGPASDSGATASNRPTLRRGKPVEPLPEDEVPGYSKPGKAASAAPASASADATRAAPAADDKAPIDMVPAISDAAGPDPRSFAFEWLKDEEGDRKKQMVALAKDQVRTYVEAQAKARITPKPLATQAARHTAPVRAKEPILENVQMKAYDLWANNQPVMVLCAEAHMPPPPAGVAFSAVDAEMQYSIMLVAYPDIYNNLHKIYSGVTDKYHLDITPRLELIDAVDADGDRRGELLFREISDGSKGWVIYRPTQDKLWKMFDSLHPE
ncbi:MAG TPA: hypothetical protein VIX37_12405 [Candidatus Sulfotelmatobacter sp.]